MARTRTWSTMSCVFVIFLAHESCTSHGSVLDSDLGTVGPHMSYSALVNLTLQHKSQIDQLFQLLQNASNMIASLQSQLEHKNQDISDLRTQVDGILGVKNISFTAKLSAPLTLHHDDVIVFNDVINNEGDGYDPSTGYFTCNQTGTYLFSVSVEGLPHGDQSSADLPVAIFVDGVKVGYAVSDPQHTGHDAQGAVTVVVRVTAGQKVWVAPYYRDQVDVYRTFSSFTGVLLH